MVEYWPFYVPGGAIIIATIACLWWLKRLQGQIENHAERISRLEGREDK